MDDGQQLELAELRIMAIAKQFVRKGRVRDSEGRAELRPLKTGLGPTSLFHSDGHQFHLCLFENTYLATALNGVRLIHRPPPLCFG